jgi:hypothetical protein
MFSFSVFVVGFTVGTSAGYAAAAFVFSRWGDKMPIDPQWHNLTIVLVAILLGTVAVFAFKGIIKVVQFAAGALFGVTAYAMFMAIKAGGAPDLSLGFIVHNFSAWSAGAGVALGVCFVLLEKSLIILYTSAIGAYIVSMRLGRDMSIFYGLIIAGTLFQFLIGWSKSGVSKTK